MKTISDCSYKSIVTERLGRGFVCVCVCEQIKFYIKNNYTYDFKLGILRIQ